MQFRQSDKEAIIRGDITLTFRRWRRPQARLGGEYRVAGHVITVTAIDQIEPSQILSADARAAGHDSPESVLSAIQQSQRKSGDAEAPLYRIAFQSLGPRTDPREALALDADLPTDTISELTNRLLKMDTRSRHGPWTTDTLAAIDAAPGRRAADLAAAQGRETAKFKADVRKLKAMGLTISREVGYELSPRGRVVLGWLQSQSQG